MYAANCSMFANGVIFISSHPSWIPGILNLVLGIKCGSTRIQTRDFSMHTQMRAIDKYKVTYVENVPYDLREMLDSGRLANIDMTSLKHVMITGYKAPLALLKEFNTLLPNGNVHNLYG